MYGVITAACKWGKAKLEMNGSHYVASFPLIRYLFRVVLKISLDRFRVCFQGQSVSKRRSNAGIVTKLTYALHRKET